MTRTKSDAKRAAILDAAVTQFSRYGFRRTSMEEVASAAGVAKGTVYLYVRTKQELFREVCTHVADSFLRRAEAARARGGALGDIVYAVLEAKFVFLYELVHSSPHASEIITSKNHVAAEVFVTADRDYLELLAAVLEEGETAGALTLAARGLSASEAAGLLIRCAHGTGSGDPPDQRVDLPEYRRRLTAMTHIVLAGLGTRSTRAPAPTR